MPGEQSPISTPLSEFQAKVWQAAQGMSDKSGAADVLRSIADSIAPRLAERAIRESEDSLASDTTAMIVHDEEAKARASEKARKAHYEAKVAANERASHRCLFNPNAGGRLSWDICLILPMLAYLTMMMPFQMCFANEPSGFIKQLETVMDLIFILDILVNFRTAYYDGDSGEIEWDDCKVAMHYVKGWFCLDTVSAIPFGLLEQGALSNLSGLKLLKSGRVLKAVKLLRFLKLSRLIKGSKFFMNIDPEALDRFEDFLADGVIQTFLRMLRICIVMGVICHFMACVWVLVGRMAVKEGKESWLDHDPVISLRVAEFEAGDTTGGKHVSTIYIAAYYFCFTTMTTVGYGDVYPYNNSERIVCICLQAFGAFVSAWVIASLTSIATQEDANAAFVAERLDAVASYTAKLEVPADLGRRIRRHFRNFFAQKSSLDESQILHDMSTGLRAELSSFLVQAGAMSEVDLFSYMDRIYWAKVLPLLRPVVYGRNEVVTSQGDVCVETFIITDGFATGCTIEGLGANDDDDDDFLHHHHHHDDDDDDDDGSEYDYSEAQSDYGEDGNYGDGSGGRFERAKELRGLFHQFVAHGSGSVELPKGRPLNSSFHHGDAEEGAAFRRQSSRGIDDSRHSNGGTTRLGGGGGGGGEGTGEDAAPRHQRQLQQRAGESLAVTHARQLEEAFCLEGGRLTGGGDSGLGNGNGNSGGGKAMAGKGIGVSGLAGSGVSAAELKQHGVHLRVLGPASTVDVLCALKVYGKSVETVRTTERMSCYALDVEDFYQTFKDNPDVCAIMQERVVCTQFKMGSPPSGTTGRDGGGGGGGDDERHSYGIPLFMHGRQEKEVNDATFLRKRMKNEAKTKKARLRAKRIALRNSQEDVRSSGAQKSMTKGGYKVPPEKTRISRFSEQ